MRAETFNLLAMFKDAIGDHIKPDALVADLTPGQRQIGGICKVYAKNGPLQGLKQVLFVPETASFSCFVNFLESEEESNEIILFTNGPCLCEVETLLKPQHGLETSNGLPRSME